MRQSGRLCDDRRHGVQPFENASTVLYFLSGPEGVRHDVTLLRCRHRHCLPVCICMQNKRSYDATAFSSCNLSYTDGVSDTNVRASGGSAEEEADQQSKFW